MSWTWLAVAVVVCFVLKLLGLLVPQRALDSVAMARTAAAAPVALLAALIAVQTFAEQQQLTVDSRAAGLAVAGLLIWRRAPFLAVVAGAAATTAVLRWTTG